MIPRSLASRRGNLCVLLLFVSTACAQEGQLQLVNLAHLNHLYEEMTVEDIPMAIIHIYSEFPRYDWVDAPGEGIACVDDAARAAVVYLRHFELSGDTLSLHRASKLIDFCRYMQAEDGQFYNFIAADFSINRKGRSSYKSFGWWAARGVWALGEGYRVFRTRDSSYAEVLKRALNKTFVHIDTLLQRYPTTADTLGFSVPRWLLYNSAADATSELTLGLSAYYSVAQEARVRSYLQKFGEAFLAMQLGDEEEFPYGAILSWQNIWHGWANGQTQALASIAGQVSRDDFLAAARLEVGHFFPYLQKENLPREIEFVRVDDEIRAEKIQVYSQIAYALRPMIVGALRVSEGTKDRRFAELAAEMAMWFFGDNPARAQMYDPSTGRCFDGILSQTEINRNAGAESTIEALYAILEIEANPTAREILYGRLKRQE